LDAAVFGNAIHLVVPEAAKATTHVKDFLTSKGINVGRIDKIRPSLEDVFVSLTSERSAGQERAA
jgi:ABC-2 type transport system ATP-binding protein